MSYPNWSWKIHMYTSAGDNAGLGVLPRCGWSLYRRRKVFGTSTAGNLDKTSTTPAKVINIPNTASPGGATPTKIALKMRTTIASA